MALCVVVVRGVLKKGFKLLNAIFGYFTCAVELVSGMIDKDISAGVMYFVNFFAGPKCVSGLEASARCLSIFIECGNVVDGMDVDPVASRFY